MDWCEKSQPYHRVAELFFFFLIIQENTIMNMIWPYSSHHQKLSYIKASYECEIGKKFHSKNQWYSSELLPGVQPVNQPKSDVI